VALTGGILLAGCTEDFAAINTNPNAPTDVNSRFLVSSAMRDAAANVLGNNFLNLWAQHTSRIEYAWDGRYDVRDYSGMWTGFYAGPMADFSEIESQGAEAGRPNDQAVGTIMKAWLYQSVTDLWGDVPYSQALLGDENTQPQYNAQQEVYEGLLAQLAAAGGLTSPGGDNYQDADLIYQGDMERWRIFANSLRLRLAMRLTEVDPATARAEAASAIAAGVFGSNDDHAIFRWLNELGSNNPWFSGEVERPGGHRISSTIVDTLKSYEDPRLAVFARPNDEGEYVGHQSGLKDGHGIPFPARSKIGARFVRDLPNPSVLMSYSEVLFLEAEAAARGYTGGNAAQLYHDAIRASMEWYDIASADTEAYLASPRVAYDPARGLEQIGLQMWVGFFGQGIEAFSNWRRTGYPNLAAGPDNVTGGIIPRRLRYSEEEQSLNSANLSAAISRQGGAELGDRVWWNPTR
jgi:hypothetical protein